MGIFLPFTFLFLWFLKPYLIHQYIHPLAAYRITTQAVCWKSVNHSLQISPSLEEMLKVDSEPFLIWLSMTTFHSFPGGQLWSTCAWLTGETVPWLEQPQGAYTSSLKERGGGNGKCRRMRGRNSKERKKRRGQQHSEDSSVKEIFTFISLS